MAHGIMHRLSRNTHWMGHSNVAQTLNTYAEADPDAKRTALGKIQDAFDIEQSDIFKLPEKPALIPTFTVAQLEAMLAEARKREGLEN